MSSENKRPWSTKFDANEFVKQIEQARQVDWEMSSQWQWFRDNGWDISYKQGLVDKTPHYTRYEEDCILIKNDRYIMQINIPSCCLVLQLIHDNEDYYGGKPTMFLDYNTMLHLTELTTYLNDVVAIFEK